LVRKATEILFFASKDHIFYMGSRHTHTHNHNEERINHLIQQNHALVTQTQSLDKKLTLAQQ